MNYEYFWLPEVIGDNGVYAGPSERAAPWLLTSDPYSAFRFDSKDECQKWIDEQRQNNVFRPIEHGFEII
uniref:Uncharacterized protein n=1 Tax=viral metagenome TaxID=1070528 RepID=A0A6M3IZF8_9ZZZZ